MWGRWGRSLINIIGRWNNNTFCWTNSSVFRHKTIRLSGDNIIELCHICHCIYALERPYLSSVGSAKKQGGTGCYRCPEQEKLSLPKLNSLFIPPVSDTRRSFKHYLKRRFATVCIEARDSWYWVRDEGVITFVEKSATDLVYWIIARRTKCRISATFRLFASTFYVI
jgi:hypothetical protein